MKDEKIIQNIKDKLALLPDKPGVYFMKDIKSVVIYIGKAKSLKKRVSSYFNGSAKDFKTETLVSHICDIDYIATENEVEAIILEAELIHKNQPHYNIELKDQKSFPFIAITNEIFPKIVKTRNLASKGQNNIDKRFKHYYGPFVDAAKASSILKYIEKNMKLRTCKLVFPLKKTRTPCLNYHIGKCIAPCSGKVKEDEYNAYIEESKLLLEGKIEDLVYKLKEKMKTYAEGLEFEKAKDIRDEIDTLSSIVVEQNILDMDEDDKDIIAIYGEYGIYSVILLISRNGRLVDKQNFYINAVADVSDILREFITQFYIDEKNIPPKIITSFEIEDRESINEWFVKKNIKTKLAVETENETGLIKIANENARLSYEERNAIKEIPDGLLRLSSLFKSEKPLKIIESFDIAHMAGKYTMASMVRFVNGKSDNKNYRLFNIKTVDGIDDFASMKEAVARRYRRIKEEKGVMPDLILIDGGRGQLNAAIEALKSIDIKKQKIISLAKKFEEIYLPNIEEPLRLENNDSARLLLQKIRDETHRFVNTNQGTKTRRQMLKSELEDIKGVGSKTIIRLYSMFNSIEEIRNASVEEIHSIAGISNKIAEAIYKHFR